MKRGLFGNVRTSLRRIRSKLISKSPSSLRLYAPPDWDELGLPFQLLFCCNDLAIHSRHGIVKAAQLEYSVGKGSFMVGLSLRESAPCLLPAIYFAHHIFIHIVQKRFQCIKLLGRQWLFSGECGPDLLG